MLNPFSHVVRIFVKSNKILDNTSNEKNIMRCKEKENHTDKVFKKLIDKEFNYKNYEYNIL
jgi:hypothetical protein